MIQKQHRLRSTDGDTFVQQKKVFTFSCTICQRTFVCLFYYCLYNSFLFIEHSSMSVKCFFSYLKQQNLFLYVKENSLPCIGQQRNPNKRQQTNLNRETLTPTLYAHSVTFVFQSEQCFIHGIQMLNFPHASCYMNVCCFLQQLLVNECHSYTKSSIFISIHHLFSFLRNSLQSIGRLPTPFSPKLDF